MPHYATKLTKREEIAFSTMTFHFKKPAGFTFKAGQHVEVKLISPPETDAEGNSRSFTLASTPEDPELMIATRMRDTAFKRVLRTMRLGSEVTIEGPFGSFILHNDTLKPAVFLAGGTGITPFRSIAQHATKNNLSHTLYLFYSNRRPEDAAFLKELRQLEKENRNFKFIATMTEAPARSESRPPISTNHKRAESESGGEKSSQPWSGERSYINKEMLAKYLDDFTKPIFYIAGPPAMVAAMRDMLNNAGVDDDNIRTEEFAGY